jgi:serine kinase of HPr protein (carbohydrate metabolism regulator)
VNSLSIARLYEDQSADLQLELLSSPLASRAEITLSDINRPGMALMGFRDNFLPERIQILAQTELTYLRRCPPTQVKEALTGCSIHMPRSWCARGSTSRPT